MSAAQHIEVVYQHGEGQVGAEDFPYDQMAVWRVKRILDEQFSGLLQQFLQWLVTQAGIDAQQVVPSGRKDFQRLEAFLAQNVFHVGWCLPLSVEGVARCCYF